VPKNNYLGCGTYLFRPNIFDYIRITPPSLKTKRVELTDVINLMANKGGKVYPFKLKGEYINVNNIDDYNAANYMLRSLEFDTKKVSLIIPAYNEESSIGYVIDDFKGKIDEIIVVNNNSKDNTEKIAKEKGAKVFSGSFKGYGDALKFGMDQAQGDIFILTEADGSFFARDLGKILEYLKDADMVLGTRTTRQMIEQAANMKFLLRWGNLIVAKLIELLWLYGHYPRLTDVGCTFRGIWKSAYDEIKDSLKGIGPEFSPEMIIEAIRHNKRTIEIPITYSSRVGGESKLSKNIMGNARTAMKMLRLIFHKRILSFLS
jgi:glycosyltransferase involved in cell wall biosynthesis